jgi:hypothetical protein
VRVAEEHGSVVIDVTDGGPAMAASLRPTAFTMPAQHSLKERSDGRYVRAAGLFAAHLAAEALGATLSTSGADGRAIFRLSLPRAK